MARRFKAIAGARLAAKGRPGVSLSKLALTVGVTAVFCGLLWGRLRGLDLAAVVAALAQVTPQRWAGAVAATGISFWAVGRYDDAAHRHLGTGVPAAQARRAGVCGIALSQLLGMGLVTGALVRWRMLPSLSLLQAGRLTLAVSLLFLAGWALVTAVAVLALGGPFQPIAVLVLALWAAAIVLALRPPHRWRALPNILTLGRVAGLAAVDCLAAGLAFWCLWPGASDLAALLPGFLMALGAGLMSGTPGGLGAFELTLMAQLPGVAEPPLLAAVLAWRVVYFLIPAALALVALLRGPLAARREDVVAAVPDGLAFPEAGLMRQGEFRPLVVSGTMLAAARTPHALVALRQPLGGAFAAHALLARAQREARVAVVYKASSRVAVMARQAGLAVLPLAREAWLDPSSFALEAPERAALRRKLRKAATAGVQAGCEGIGPELARLNADWAQARGGEQGFSMGRFEPGYLAGQRVYVARLGLRPVGFASFHVTEAGWALDLLRPHPEAPDGTGHVLMAVALADAARAGVRRLSLAAVPEPAFGGKRGRVLALLMRVFPGSARAARGLWQFKQAFAPSWERLYLIAPGFVSMALAGWDIRRAVTQPRPLLPATAAFPASVPAVADIAIASHGSAWQMGRR